MIECRAPKNKKEFEQYYYLRWLVLRAPWKKERGSEKDQLEKQAIHRCVFDENNHLLAVGRAHFIDQFQAQIRYMAVVESSQKNGVGKLLLESLEHEIICRGGQSIQLKARESAVGFYQKMGYEALGLAHKLYNEIQHVSMVKNTQPLPNQRVDLAQNLQAIWHQTIPLSKAMNINISFYDEQVLMTNCDPVFNKNLHNTMFAGSIYTLATLTGWGWVYFQLNKAQYQGDIVLADAKIKYLSPINGVVSAKTSQEFAQGDINLLMSHIKTRFTIKVDIYSGEIIAAKFIGEYVVIKKEHLSC
ncbi:YiiD C-terminal domain-containing protein [Colwelliaceae bacterium 6441]